jgi:hypothetical protein
VVQYIHTKKGVLKMKVFTAEQAKQIAELTEELKGTADFGKYYMSLEYKRGKKWEYIGWSVPPTNADGMIKKYKDKTYIMYDVQGEQRRYTMTKEIEKLIGK